MQSSRLLKAILLPKSTLIFLFTCVVLQVNAQVKIVVVDDSSKEPIIGATISIKELSQNVFSGMDGSYTFKNIPAGTYTFSCAFTTYKTKEELITVSETEQEVVIKLKSEENEIDEVIVKAYQDGGSDRYARNMERKSDNIINVLSAKSIQLLPDITTAGILQRVSGVSLERTSTGDARYAVIRGMDQRYNYTLVNGIKIPSPDNKFRYVPMDMFPADLLERLEVHKALTPEMEGDAIGGAMNLVMKNATDKLTVNANLGTGFSQLLAQRGYTNFDRSVVNFKSPSDLHGPTYVATPNDFTFKNFDYSTKRNPVNSLAGFSFGNRYLKSGKLGVVLAGSYQNLYRGSNSTWFKPENQPQPGNVPSFNDIYIRQYNTQQMRIGVHSKIDYAFSPKHKISLYTMYMELNETQYRSTIDTSLSIGRSGVGTGNTYLSYRSRIKDQSIYNSTLQGEHELFKHFKVNWSGVYSLAKSETPDWSEYQTVHQVGFDANGNQTVTPEVLNIPFYRIWTRNTDRDYAGYLNLSYKFKLFHKEFKLSAGGLYRNKLRNNFYNEWDLIPKTSSTGQPVPYDGVLSPDKFQFNGTSAAQGNQVNPLTYTATEIIFAYYGQVNVEITEKFSVLTGVRVENTKQGWITAQDPKVAYGARGKVPYQDVLPSMHLKYKLTKKMNLRASYFSAINRPGFFEYVPFKVSDDNFSLSGNPQLKHTTSQNFDLRYEYFPKGLDQLLIGGFYKDITNPIETAVEFTGTSSATLKPFNFGKAVNYGVEVCLTKYWGKFGVSGNYTYTHSSITTSKLYYDTNFVAEQRTQTRPLQGQAPHIANVSLLYKNQDIGLDIQLAYVFTGSKITFVSPYQDLDYWQKATSQLDFSIEQRFLKHFTVYCKISNLLNTPILVEIRQPNVYRTGKFALPGQTRDDRVTVQKETYGQNFIFGVRYKLVSNKKK